MKCTVAGVLLAVAALVPFASVAGAEELTVDSILTMHQSGAPADIMIAKIDSPGNRLAVTAEDLVTLRNEGVPASVISAISAHMPAMSAEILPVRPDDTRLIDLVRLVEAGISESVIAEQVRQSGQTYALSVNDLLYLEKNGAGDSMIMVLMATRTGLPATPAAPSELVFDDLELVNEGFWRRDRNGRLVMRGDTLQWEGRHGSGHNFEIQVPGLEKVWYTCEARASESFCYQLNLEIVKGGTYRFRDRNRESGSNEAVTRVMEALRTYFPRLPFREPDD